MKTYMFLNTYSRKLIPAKYFQEANSKKKKILAKCQIFRFAKITILKVVDYTSVNIRLTFLARSLQNKGLLRINSTAKIREN